MVNHNPVFNLRGFYNVRRAPKLVKLLEEMAESIASTANARDGLTNGYQTNSEQGASSPQGRHRTTAFTESAEAIGRNAANQTLLHSIDAARR